MVKTATPAEGREWQVKVGAELNVGVNLNFREGRVAGVGRLLVLETPGGVAAL